MFSRHYRKVKAIFAATDVLLTSIAFVAAYQTRLRLHLEKNFFIDFPVAALLLVLLALCWVTIGYWFDPQQGNGIEGQVFALADYVGTGQRDIN